MSNPVFDVNAQKATAEPSAHAQSGLYDSALDSPAPDADSVDFPVSTNAGSAWRVVADAAGGDALNIYIERCTRS